MSDKPTISILEAKALEKARLLEQAAALDREMAEIAQIEELAAKYNLTLIPAAPTVMPWAVESLRDLIQIYKNYENSPYQGISHASRTHYDTLLGSISEDRGAELLAQLSAEKFEIWHAKWSEGGKKSMGHAKIKMVRLVMGFGAGVLHNRECERLFGVLCKLKFEAPKARNERLTTAQANLIRVTAHRLERPSIALAQAFQSDIGLLQKDAIGAWVPLEENGVSDITEGSMKWVRGIRWSEIDANVIMRHSSDSWLGDIEFDLRKAPMVLDEFKRQYDFTIDRSPRSQLRTSGPIVVSEYDGLPWDAIEFRRWWRKVADACGIPKNVRNSDSRSRIKNSVQEADEEETEAQLAKN